jgi:hypothetical protein
MADVSDRHRDLTSGASFLAGPICLIFNFYLGVWGRFDI